MPPLTGLVGLYGEEIVRAAQLACEEVNTAGGVLGRPLELVVEDDGSLPESAVAAATRLALEHRCAALVGNLLSNSRIAVAYRVAEPLRLPYLNFSFYEGSILSRYFFHFAALPNQQIDRMIPFMSRRYGPRMFFAGSRYEWPRGSIDAGKRVLLRGGGQVVGETYLPIGATDEAIDRLLDEVHAADPDVFVPYFAGSDQVHLLTRFTERGMKPRMAVVMGHFDEVMAARLPGAVREGFYSCNTYFMSLDNPGNRRVLARLATWPGVSGLCPAGNGTLTNFGEGAWQCVRAFALAANAAGTIHPEALVDALAKVVVDGPQGRVRMDPGTHHAEVNTCLARCRADGSFEVVEAFGALPPVLPERYRHLRLGAQPLPEEDIRWQARMLEQMSEAVFLVGAEDTTIIYANPGAERMFGYARRDMEGRPLSSLNGLPGGPGRSGAADIAAVLYQKGSWEGEVRNARQDGTVFWCRATISAFTHPLRGEVWMVVEQDITQRKNVEAELEYRATHDALTGLANRYLLADRLEQSVVHARRSGRPVAAMLLDLDRFKLINDSLGHEVGDVLLREVAHALVASVRAGDTVARRGGDEFMVVVTDVGTEPDLVGLARKLLDAVTRPHRVGGRDLVTTASLGIAICPRDGDTGSELIKNADVAMYRAKELGRNAFQFYAPEMNARMLERVELERGLRRAVAEGELEVWYQPKVAVAGGAIVGAEALLRWRHPVRGLVTPGEFIPLAEETGLIIPIGDWVIDHACRAVRAWHEAGFSGLHVAVNISARQFQRDHLADVVAAAMAAHGVPAGALQLEVTESAVMRSPEATAGVLGALKAVGVGIALDDFGTGYSSLSYLKRFPIDVVKIDQSFVRDITTDPDDAAIARLVIDLGHALGHRVVAEGVETEAQLDFLRGHGCDEVQGYLFSRPVPGGDFVGLLNG